MNQKILSILIVALASVSFASAQSETCKQKPCNRHFERVDTNNDGRISLDEFKQFKPKRRAEIKDEVLTKHFQQMDKNNDQYLSAEEFQELRTIRQRARFDKIDANGDGTIDFAEFQNSLAERSGQKQHQRRPLRCHGGRR